MWDLILISLSLLLLLGGILGAFIPVLPGPPLSFAGLVVMHFTSRAHFSLRLILIMAILTTVITLLDLFLPSYATRRSGGSRLGMIGAITGLILGIFVFPPAGIILGPFLGAFLGELINQTKPDVALHAAMGSFLGLLTGVLLKLVLALVISWYALRPLFI